MLILLSESTAARRRLPFACVDETDGKTPETGLTFAAGELQLSKNGAAFANAAGTVTELSDGAYHYEATAAELDTVGFLLLKVEKTGVRLVLQLAAQVVATDPYTAQAAAPTAAANAAAVWAAVSEGAETFGDAIRLIGAVLFGRATIPEGDGSYAFRNKADTKNRIAGTVTATARTVSTRDGT